MLTILYEDVEALFDGQGGVENDETEAERKNVVTGADLEEISNCALEEEKAKDEGLVV